MGVAVVERDLDVFSGLDDMEIGQDLAFAADQNARTETQVALRRGVRTFAEEMAEDRVVEQRVALFLDGMRRVDVHHGRQRGACRVAV